jgi:hypothetical protein
MKRCLITFILLACSLQIFAGLRSSKDTVGPSKCRFVVIDKETRLPIDSAEITIRASHDTTSKAIFTGSNGSAETIFEPGSDYITVFHAHPASGEGVYFSFSKAFGGRKEAFYTDTIEFERQVIADRYMVFPPVHFAGNSFAITDTATINLWIEGLNWHSLKEKGILKIWLDGNNDCKETITLISKKRADAVAEYMVHHGLIIDVKNITITGYGNQRPLNDCNCNSSKECAEDDYAANRRVDLKLGYY